VATAAWYADEGLGKRVEAELVVDPRLDALAAWPFPAATTYFMSGTNHPAEIQALADRGEAIGVAVNHLAPAAMQALFDLAGTPVRVFVDSGAFSEVEFGPHGPVYPKPISDDEWLKRLRKYVRLAEVLGKQAYLVAPDKIADQQGTLDRLERYAPIMAQVAALGARILVPVQKGTLDMAAIYNVQLQILHEAGVPLRQVYPAIPLKKDATSIADLQAFIRAMRCREEPRPRIHFLGRGLFSPDYRATYAAALAACPWLEITADSVRFRSSAFLGSRAKPGPWMIAQDLLRELGASVADVKRYGLHLALDQQDLAQLIEAVQAGWYDAELFDSAAEQLAWLARYRRDADA
jgi:hypothetical protein